jgi:hypothetical protein
MLAFCGQVGHDEGRRFADNAGNARHRLTKSGYESHLGSSSMSTLLPRPDPLIEEENEWQL